MVVLKNDTSRKDHSSLVRVSGGSPGSQGGPSALIPVLCGFETAAKRGRLKQSMRIQAQHGL